MSARVSPKHCEKAQSRHDPSLVRAKQNFINDSPLLLSNQNSLFKPKAPVAKHISTPLAGFLSDVRLRENSFDKAFSNDTKSQQNTPSSSKFSKYFDRVNRYFFEINQNLEQKEYQDCLNTTKQIILQIRQFCTENQGMLTKRERNKIQKILQKFY